MTRREPLLTGAPSPRRDVRAEAAQLLQGILGVVRAGLPPGVTEADLEGFLARHERALGRVVREALEARRTADRTAQDAEREARRQARAVTLLPLGQYDLILVGFSGGKDSLAALLAVQDELARQGEQTPIELWHHLVDGAEGEPHFMDWPVSADYARKVAAALKLPIRFQWKEGGFLREMLRDNEPTAPTAFEQVLGGVRRVVRRGGTSGRMGTRHRFPQTSADLTVRWCSSYLKIDVAARAIAHDVRFQKGGRVLLVTGERAEESTARARYLVTELHRSHTRTRTVHQWRPILSWREDEVWARIQQAGIVPHPAYRFGYSRVSCAKCIFGGPPEWATARALDPEGFAWIARLEREFGVTIARDRSVIEQADRGESFIPRAQLTAARKALMSEVYDGPILVAPSTWSLPVGAFRHTAGPV